MSQTPLHTSPTRWAIRTISEELFLIFSAGWVLLFVLESLKQGLVSHYLSLPHLAFFLLVLGGVMLALQPEQSTPVVQYQTTRYRFILATLSALAGLSIILITDLPVSLTLLLVFVTVFALWAGSITLREDE